MSSFVNFDPESEAVEIAQNLRMIMNTPKFSVPLHRDFGLNFAGLDEPIMRVQAEIRRDLINAIAEFEPRVQIVSIEFTGSSAEGRLQPSIQFKIKSETSTGGGNVIRA